MSQIGADSFSGLIISGLGKSDLTLSSIRFVIGGGVLKDGTVPGFSFNRVSTAGNSLAMSHSASVSVGFPLSPFTFGDSADSGCGTIVTAGAATGCGTTVNPGALGTGWIFGCRFGWGLRFRTAGVMIGIPISAASIL